MATNNTDFENTDRLQNGALTHTICIVAGGLGALGLVATLVYALLAEEGWTRAGFAYVTNYAFFLSIALGSLCFILWQHLSRAGWSVTVRRTAEHLAGSMPIMALLFIPVLVGVYSGSGDVFSWAQPVPEELKQVESTHIDVGHDVTIVPIADEAHGDDKHGGYGEGRQGGYGYDALTHKKRPYLNAPFFLIRWIGYFILWGWLARYMWKNSIRQDQTGEPRLSVRMEKVSAPGLVLFALSVTFASFDLLMSLDPHWFSTIFGVYYFSGGMMATFATLIILTMLLQRTGLLKTSINNEHRHDLGKFLFAFVFFWGYIAFSQYMLIWYGNIPEETAWFMRRGAATHEPNAWSGVLILLLIGHLLVPFAGLLSRHIKRRPGALLFWAVWLLVMHWIDIWWIVMPQFDKSSLTFGIPEIASMIGIGGLMIAAAARLAGDRPLIPIRDPRLPEAYGFRNI